MLFKNTIENCVSKLRAYVGNPQLLACSFNVVLAKFV